MLNCGPFPYQQAVRENIILKYVCHFCLCGPELYMEITVQPVKVVEPNNFLMYTMHECKRSFHTVFLYLFSVYTLSLLQSIWKVFSSSGVIFVLSWLQAFSRIAPPMKKYTRVSGDDLCILFKGLQWMCATRLCIEFWLNKQQATLPPLKYVYIRCIYNIWCSIFVKSYFGNHMATLIPLYNQ